MLSPIVITNENFSDADVGSLVSTSASDRWVTIWDPKLATERLVLSDFGTFFVGFDSREEIEADENLPLWVGETDVSWIVPAQFKMSHLAKRLGVFPSVGQAMKNGWNMEIPAGFSQHVIRINKIRGVISILKKA